MAHPLPPGSLSLTGAGAALVTGSTGAVEPDEVTGLIVGDVRVLSSWRITANVTARLAARERTGPSSDRLVWTLGSETSIDPVGILERARTVSQSGFQEVLTITAFVEAIPCSLDLVAARDDRPVYNLGDGTPGAPPSRVLDGPDPGRYRLQAPRPGGDDITIEAPGWVRFEDRLSIDVRVEPGSTWTTTLAVMGVQELGDPEGLRRNSLTAVDSSPPALAAAVDTSRADLLALTMRIDARPVFAAGSPFFLALFGRDSLISGMQALVDTPTRLDDILHVLARNQATTTDASSRAQPGRILHELRVGRAGVFGVPPGTPYFGAVDTSALFVVALGEAMRWGAPRETVAALLPAAQAALGWCRDVGDVDGDGFIESVPDPGGLTNLGWKDSGDSIVRTDGSVVVGSVALAEVQAYWYRAARVFAEIEQWLEIGDGSASLAEADRLAGAFASAFVFDSDGAPFVGLALDPDKQLLEVRSSNAGHVLWSGILEPATALAVSRQLAAPDLFSGWGVRTLGAAERGYNPFGYHRGSVWPHDTGFALHGAARYGDASTVGTLAGGLIALGEALGGQLPELLSGIGRSDARVPVPYAAACRPQAWAAGTPLVVLRSLLGLEPDVPNGLVRLHPALPSGHELTVRRMRLGDHELSLTVRGTEVVDVESTLDIVAGPDAILAATGWCPDR